MTRQYRQWIVLWLLLFGFIQPVFAYYDDDGYYSDYSEGVPQPVYHIQEDIDLIPTDKLQYAKPKIIAKTVYPLLTSYILNENVDVFNEIVQEMLKEDIAYFKKQVAENQSLQKSLSKSAVKNDLIIDFATSVLNTHGVPIVSIRFNIQGSITGLAHPYHRHRVLNFDLGTGQKIELADLFRSDTNYLEILSEYSRHVLSKKLKTSSKRLLWEGTEPLPANYQNWNLRAQGILITFDEYQVAPAVQGTQTVLIPYSAIQGMLAPKSPLARCLKRKNKCLRNHIVTGGFADDAA